jgi:hypothetical protein
MLSQLSATAARHLIHWTLLHPNMSLPSCYGMLELYGSPRHSGTRKMPRIRRLLLRRNVPQSHKNHLDRR